MGTDIFRAAISRFGPSGIARYTIAGNVDWASVRHDPHRLRPAGSGSAATRRSCLPAGTLRTILGVVLIGAAMGLGSKAGAIPPWAIAVVPGILAVIDCGNGSAIGCIKQRRSNQTERRTRSDRSQEKGRKEMLRRGAA